MANREPLLDTDWLLGSPDTHGSWWPRFLTQTFVALILVFCGVALWPMVSKNWLQNQLTEQYQKSDSSEARNEAMIALAEILPHSLSVVVAGLSKSNPDEAHLAYEALDYYIGRVIVLPVDQRRACFAELVHGIEEASSSLPQESKLLASALVSRISAAQQADQHPGSLMMLAACRRILDGTHPQIHAKLVSTITLSDAQQHRPPNPSSSIKASLSDESVITAAEVSDSVSDTVTQEVATIDASLPPVRMTLSAKNNAGFEPPAFENNIAADASNSSFGTLRQKLHSANRFVPTTGTMSVPIQSSATISSDDGSHRSSSSNAFQAPLLAASTTTARVVSMEEEVIGIERQKTEDLIRLLGSVQPRVASAAFHELQRTRLSQKELDLAVELSQGTSEMRLIAMERLVKEAELNPIAWLVWMGSEADRSVRFKAVGLLGSIHHEDARLKLRNMLLRERDPEISRHIQNALLASGSTKSRNR